MKLAELHKRRIAAAMTTPRGVSLTRVLQQIEHAIDTFRSQMDAHSAARHKNVTVSDREVKITFNRYKSRGAPSKAPLRELIKRLVVIYENTTGKKIGRNVDADSGKEKPNTFLLACLRASGIALYPRGIVREVLNELHVVINVDQGANADWLHDRATKKPTSE
jgi:hypothetical protein